MTIWLLGFCCLVLLGAVTWQWLQRPFVHRKIETRDLGTFLETLLVRGFDQGLLVIRPPGKRDERFVQFAKYIEEGRRGLQFAFPDSTWSAHMYGEVKDLLRSLDVPFEERGTEETTTRSFILVDLGEDLETAQTIAESAVHEVFGLADDAKLRVTLSNISPADSGPP